MKTKSILTLAIVLIAFPQIHAQEPPPKPPELKVLERWSGKWNSEVTSKPAVWDREGSQYKARSTDEWKLNGRFLYTHVKAKGEQGRYEFIALRTYDEKTKAFRSWSFWFKDKASGISESSGQWDENTKTMTERAVDADRGTVADSKIRFIDKDKFDFAFVVKDKEGTILLDRHGIVRRQKADEPQDDQQQKGTPITPDLKVLDRYRGNWNTDIINNVSERNPKEMRISGTLTNEWVLDGRFMQMKGKSSTGVENIQMRTYDPQTKQYRAWLFDSTGAAASSIGQWDEQTKTMTWKGDQGNGITAISPVRFVSDDTIEWRLNARNDQGKVFMDMEGTFKRRK